MAATDPLLEITALTDGPTVTIDGEQYALRTQLYFSIVDNAKLTQHGLRLQALTKHLTLPSVEEAMELERILDETCRLVLDAPDEVMARLTDDDKLAICQVFMKLPRPALRTVGAGQTRRTGQVAIQTASRTGARSSRPSSRSTAAIRGGG